MRKKITVSVFLTLGFSVLATAQDAPQVKPLTNSKMTGIDGHHFLMAEVSIPANTSVPPHTHPTEEFLYILEGKTILRIDGREDKILTAGTSAIIPAGVIHTAITAEGAARALTNRVHPDGVPVMTPAPQ